MRVVVVNHTGLVSGAEVATLNLLRSLPDDVSALLACPEGPLARQARNVGLSVVPVTGMTGSLRLHPIQTARGVRDLVRLGRETRVVARKEGADLIHAASIRAGLAASLSLGPGLLVITSLHDCLPPGPMSLLTKRLVDARAMALVANSRHTATAWRDSRKGPPVHVVHPPVDLARYRPRGAPNALRLGLAGEGPILGVAAQITPWKGQAVAIRALAGIRTRCPGARLVLAGETKFVNRATRYDNRAYLASLKRLITTLGLESCVHFLGQRDDMPDLLASLDVLLVPSWEEPFGLVMVEAMAVGTPVVATNVGGPPEIIRDGVNGRLVPPERPDLWAAAVSGLLLDPGRRQRMAGEGLLTARGFRPEAYAAAHADIYRSFPRRAGPSPA